jgi:carbon starvation protein
MALIAACTLEPGVYLSMNVKGEAVETIAKVTALGFPVTQEQMAGLATEVGEHSLFGRTGGAATLAVGMANIFSKVTHGRWLDLWYHFAIMFEALFILTTLDAGTRVGRYILQDFLGNLYKPLGDTRKLGPNILASALIVCGWGWFLIQGVRDPLGGINSLWPLFGIANQMLAAIALCLGTTIILKTTLANLAGLERAGSEIGAPKPWLALLTLIPLIWLVAVTFTAGVQKIWHDDPRIGFLAQAKLLDQKINSPGTTAQSVDPKWLAEKKAMSATWAVQRWNNLLDAVVAGTFLTLVSVVLLLSLWEWWLLLSRRKPAVLRESEPVWLPDYALKEGGANLRSAAGTAAIALGLAKELSGEAHLERARQAEITCVCEHHADADAAKTEEQRYVEMTERRFNGVTRCC